MQSYPGSVSSGIYERNQTYACAIQSVLVCIVGSQGMVTAPCAGHSAYTRVYAMVVSVSSADMCHFHWLTYHFGITVTFITLIYISLWNESSLSPLCFLYRIFISIYLTFVQFPMDSEVLGRHVALCALFFIIFC